MTDIDLNNYEPLHPEEGAASASVTSTDEGDDEAGSRVYTLLSPRTVNGTKVTQIVLRVPSQGDIDDWGNGKIENLRAFLCRLARVEPDVIRALRWHDSAAVHQIFRDMLPEFIFNSEG